MRVALAQINPCVGDLAGNVERCLAAIEAARIQDAALVVLPEMAVPGYPPRDILFDPSFIEAVMGATADLARRASDGPPAVVGTLMPAGVRPPGHPGLYNAAVLLDRGDVQWVAAKPDAIIDDVEQGMGDVEHDREADRRAGIATALAAAGPQDTVLLAGKRHETYEVIGTEKVPFDEVAIVRELGGRRA